MLDALVDDLVLEDAGRSSVARAGDESFDKLSGRHQVAERSRGSEGSLT